MTDSAVCVSSTKRQADRIVSLMDEANTKEVTLIQRHWSALTKNYRESGGVDAHVKEQVQVVKRALASLRVEVEDEVITAKQRRFKWARIQRSIKHLSEYLEAAYAKKKKDIDAKAQHASDHSEIVQSKVNLIAMTSKPNIMSLKDLEKEIENSGGSLESMGTKLEHLVGPVGISGKNFPKTAETSRMLQKANEKHLDDSHTSQFLDETSKSDYSALVGVQKELAKLPTSLKEGQATCLVKGPVFLTTSPFISESAIKRLHLKASQVFPGWILEDQLLLAYNPKIDLSHLKSPHTTVKDGKKRTVNRSLTIDDRIEDVIESINARSPHNYMDVTEGHPLAIPGNRLRFLWLLPIPVYEGLGHFTIESIGFPKSSELIDPESKSRAQHEHDLSLHVSERKKKQDEQYKKGKSRREQMQQAAAHLVPILEELQKKETEVRQTLKTKQVEIKAIEQTVSYFKAELPKATSSQKAQFKKSLDEAQKHLSKIVEEYATEREKLLVPLTKRKRELNAEIEEIQEKFRSK